MATARWARVALTVVLSPIVAILVTEWLAYAWVGILGCEQVLTLQRPSLGGPERILVVSDVHVLGEKRRTRLDRWWTDRQLNKALAAAKFWTKPDLVAALGDHLDEGYVHTTQAQWDAYVLRLRGALGEPNPILGVVGNHDAHSAARISEPMVDRFERSFGKSNEIIRRDKTNVDVVVLNGIGLEACSRHGEQTRMPAFCREIDDLRAKVRANQTRTNILLLHVPLYRANDADCGPTRLREGAHVTYVGPHDALRAGEDVLSPLTTQHILDDVRPMLVLSGHTHAQCVREVAQGSWEVTLPTFSWRMRPDPAFGVVDVDVDHLKISICKLPHEYWTIAAYAIAALSAPLACAWTAGALARGSPSQKHE